MIASRRAAGPPPPGSAPPALSSASPALSGPRWRSVSLIAPSTAGSTARPSPRTIPQIPHIASGPSGDVAGRAARDHDAGGLGAGLEVRGRAAVGDVLEVVGELLGPGHAPRQPELGEAGDARAHDQP